MTDNTTLIEKKWFKGTLCMVATVIMFFVAGYQRKTGPSWPISIDQTLEGHSIKGKLPRSHPGEGGELISLEADPEVAGDVKWRHYPSRDAWTVTPMVRTGGALIVELPKQPPAGKLEYAVELRSGKKSVTLPESETAVIRFRGDVPAGVLIPHIIFMFLAVTVVIRTGLGLLLREDEIGRFSLWVLIFLVPGGLVLGPMVQKFAFGVYWSGWPFGGDWTDNKTLFAVIFWVVALLLHRQKKVFAKYAVILSVLVTLAVYLIPHSMHGSEIDWDKIEDSSGVAIEEILPIGEAGNSS